jgi:hypothetical protein
MAKRAPNSLASIVSHTAGMAPRKSLGKRLSYEHGLCEASKCGAADGYVGLERQARGNRFPMPASHTQQQIARRVAAGASSIAALLVLAVWWQAHASRPGDAAQTSPRQASTLAQLTALPQLRESLAQMSSLEEQYCDCSAPSQCVEIANTEQKKKLPGGGAGGLSQDDWGSWDPVTGVPRIGCPDTVTHAHYTRYKDKATGIEYVSPTNRYVHLLCRRAAREDRGSVVQACSSGPASR